MQIIAVCGNYRLGGVTERLLEEAAQGARAAGAQVEILTLRDIDFEFCRNCKHCWSVTDSGLAADCVIRDGLTPWLERIAAADGLILAVPVNFSSLTALFKKFQERCLALTRLKPLTGWPRRLAGVPAVPVSRYRGPHRPMLCITASGAPAWVGRLIMPCVRKQFLALGEAWGGRIAGLIWAGGSIDQRHQPEDRLQAAARAAGARLAASGAAVNG